jgi:hypothetical protein
MDSGSRDVRPSHAVQINKKGRMRMKKRMQGEWFLLLYHCPVLGGAFSWQFLHSVRRAEFILLPQTPEFLIVPGSLIKCSEIKKSHDKRQLQFHNTFDSSEANSSVFYLC